jgi:hypothetical protein
MNLVVSIVIAPIQGLYDRSGRVRSHSATSASIHTGLVPMVRAAGNSPLRIHAQSVGNVTGTSASTCFFDKSRGKVVSSRDNDIARSPVGGASSKWDCLDCKNPHLTPLGDYRALEDRAVSSSGVDTRLHLFIAQGD